jgi:hypothetical protein
MQLPVVAAKDLIYFAKPFVVSISDALDEILFYQNDKKILL